ncbi:MAG: twin-arginine translocation signal domain-containing protein [Proteobacteria bacterium]|nr:twin-arginine translocation signal domain-containing protein [Pseudomonadota bacterium]
MTTEDKHHNDEQKTSSAVTRREFIKYSAGTAACISLGAFSFGCGSSSSSAITPNNFKALVFSDLHFNPFYDTTLFPQLVAATDPSDWEAIFKTSKTTAPSLWGTDTNYPLLVLALSSIKQNLGASSLIMYTGDLLGHNMPKLFFSLYGSEDAKALETFANNTVAFVMGQIRAAVGNIPVMFALGNSDSYVGIIPESSFLSSNADLFYTKFLNGSVDQQEFLSTFKSGGYYSAEPTGTNLMVIGFNSVPFAYPDMETAVNAELAWLDSKLATAKASGKKVWLLMHIPPGADINAAAKNADSNGHITKISPLLMMWQAAYQTSFMNVLSKYPGVIALTLGAHTHMDEYRIMLPDSLLEITPSITPVFGNNPAFKVYTFAQDTLKPVDYSVLNYDLASMPGQFNAYYTFSTAYSMQGYLNDSLTQLTPALVTNSAQQALYRGHYFSGHNYSIPITGTNLPITNTNWPIFWCGIGKMGQQQYIDGVNSY